jgi:hypothetical protein
MTMTLIATQTAGTAAASIEFSSIPQTFTDLVVLVSGRATTENPSFYWQYNNSGGTAYSLRRLNGTGGSALSDSQSGLAFHRIDTQASGSGQTANTFDNIEIYIPNYTSSVGKSSSANAVNENNNSTARQSTAAAFWNNTAAITSILIDTDGDYVAGTTTSLYGITKGSDGIVTTS